MHTDEIIRYDDLPVCLDGYGRRVYSNEAETFYLHHNGDYSGDAKITIEKKERVTFTKGREGSFDDYYTVEIPIEVLFEFVGRALIQQDIATMEQGTGLNRLGFRGSVSI